MKRSPPTQPKRLRGHWKARLCGVTAVCSRHVVEKRWEPAVAVKWDFHTTTHNERGSHARRARSQQGRRVHQTHPSEPRGALATAELPWLGRASPESSASDCHTSGGTDRAPKAAAVAFSSPWCARVFSAARYTRATSWPNFTGSSTLGACACAQVFAAAAGMSESYAISHPCLLGDGWGVLALAQLWRPVFAQIGPVEIGPKVFTPHSASGELLNGNAVLCWHLPPIFFPLPDGSPGYAQSYSQGFLRPKGRCSAINYVFHNLKASITSLRGQELLAPRC